MWFVEKKISHEWDILYSSTMEHLARKKFDQSRKLLKFPHYLRLRHNDVVDWEVQGENSNRLDPSKGFSS